MRTTQNLHMPDVVGPLICITVWN